MYNLDILSYFKRYKFLIQQKSKQHDYSHAMVQHRRGRVAAESKYALLSLI